MRRCDMCSGEQSANKEFTSSDCGNGPAVRVRFGPVCLLLLMRLFSVWLQRAVGVGNLLPLKQPGIMRGWKASHPPL